MNKKGRTGVAGTVIAIAAVLVVAMLGIVIFVPGLLPSQSAVSPSVQTEVAQTANEVKKGGIATFGVDVRDISQTNVNTKVAATFYCQDDEGNMLADGTTASTSGYTNVKTTLGSTVTCWAFDSTYQTYEPTNIEITSEYDTVTLDAYNLSTSATGDFFKDGNFTASQTLTVTADNEDTLDKLRLKNSAVSGSGWLPLGGIYFDTVASSNVSDIDATGGVTLYGMDATSAKLVTSDLNTRVNSRKESWDYVFEIDADSAEPGNQVLLMEENDYFETGVITVKGDGDGCGGADETITPYTFQKGYYRKTLGDGIGYGHETDASSSTAIGTDQTLDTITCS